MSRGREEYILFSSDLGAPSDLQVGADSVDSNYCSGGGFVFIDDIGRRRASPRPPKR
jgi:hypothetical protein